MHVREGMFEELVVEGAVVHINAVFLRAARDEVLACSKADEVLLVVVPAVRHRALTRIHVPQLEGRISTRR